MLPQSQCREDRVVTRGNHFARTIFAGRKGVHATVSEVEQGCNILRRCCVTSNEIKMGIMELIMFRPYIHGQIGLSLSGRPTVRRRCQHQMNAFPPGTENPRIRIEATRGGAHNCCFKNSLSLPAPIESVACVAYRCVVCVSLREIRRHQRWILKRNYY